MVAEKLPIRDFLTFPNFPNLFQNFSKTFPSLFRSFSPRRPCKGDHFVCPDRRVLLLKRMILENFLYRIRYFLKIVRSFQAALFAGKKLLFCEPPSCFTANNPFYNLGNLKPSLRNEKLARLSADSDRPIGCFPNLGMPSVNNCPSI